MPKKAAPKKTATKKVESKKIKKEPAAPKRQAAKRKKWTMLRVKARRSSWSLDCFVIVPLLCGPGSKGQRKLSFRSLIMLLPVVMENSRLEYASLATEITKINKDFQ